MRHKKQMAAVGWRLASSAGPSGLKDLSIDLIHALTGVAIDLTALRASRDIRRWRLNDELWTSGTIAILALRRRLDAPMVSAAVD